MIRNCGEKNCAQPNAIRCMERPDSHQLHVVHCAQHCCRFVSYIFLVIPFSPVERVRRVRLSFFFYNFFIHIFHVNHNIITALSVLAQLNGCYPLCNNDFGEKSRHVYLLLVLLILGL